MPTVSELQVVINADVSGVEKGIAQAEKSMGGFGSKVTSGIGGLVSGFSTLGLAAEGVGAAIDGIKGIGAVFGIGALNEMEQTRASFNAFTKDAAKTEEIMAQVRTEANKTPFAFGEMAKATASLMPVAKSSGTALMDLVKEAEILAASNPLEGLEGASFSLREAMTGDFTSIIERFNLSRSTINKLKEEGVPNLEIVRRAMQEMGFDSDLIAAKAETLDGRWSTFQDTLQTLQTRMGQPIFDAMKEGLVGLQGALDSSMPALEGLADTVAGGLTQAINTGKAALSGLVEIFRRVFQGDIAGAVEMLRTALGNIGRTISDQVEVWASAFAGWVDGADSELMDNLGDLLIGIQGWVQESGFAIIEKLATWAGAFVDWVAPKIPPLLRELGELLVKVGTWVVNDGAPTLISKLAEWGLAFVEWVAPRIPPLLLELGKLLVELGTWIITTALPAIVSKLAEWAGAFVEWVAPKIPPLLLELAKLLAALGLWLSRDALPEIILKLAEWATAFVDWVAPKIPDLLAELAKLQIKLLLWIGEQVAGIVSKLGEWGAAFLGWIAKDVLPSLPEKLGEIFTGITRWVGEKVAGVAEEASKLGAGFVNGIRDGISGALGGFWNWLQTNFVDKIPSFVKELLNIRSPSGVFADIGRNIVEGLRVGMEQRLPSIDDLIERLVGRIATTGEVTDWLKAAMQIAGVGSDWLPGLARLVSWESSGNPRAVNPESVNGEHATGLLQTLPSTFRRYALPDMGDILNPIHNAAAAIRYIKRTYGSVYEIPGIASGNRSEFPGYGEGGIAWNKQLAWVGEREPEAIIPRSWFGNNAGGNTYVIDARGAQVYDGTKFVDMLVANLERAERGGRIVKVTR